MLCPFIPLTWPPRRTKHHHRREPSTAAEVFVARRCKASSGFWAQLCWAGAWVTSASWRRPGEALDDRKELQWHHSQGLPCSCAYHEPRHPGDRSCFRGDIVVVNESWTATLRFPCIKPSYTTETFGHCLPNTVQQSAFAFPHVSEEAICWLPQSPYWGFLKRGNPPKMVGLVL